MSKGKKNTSCLSKMLTEIDFCVQTNDTLHYLLKAFESFCTETRISGPLYLCWTPCLPAPVVLGETLFLSLGF